MQQWKNFTTVILKLKTVGLGLEWPVHLWRKWPEFAMEQTNYVHSIVGHF